MFIQKIKQEFINLLYSCLEKNQYKPEHANISYSQEGEDMILRRIFENKNNGFYVDIGAHHPKRFSNTYYFYQRGWHGINIDAMPRSMENFRKLRPRDINLEIAIGNISNKNTYYIFNEPALNTFSTETAIQIEKKSNYKLINKISIELLPLSLVIKKYLPPEMSINFLSIDVEGLDLDVIQSNNWDEYHPEIVLVEERCRCSINDVLNGDVNKFMRSVGYRFIAKTFNTVFYKRYEM